MPASLIEQHNHEEILEVCGDLLEKQVHHLGVRIGKDKRSHLTKTRTNRGVNVQEFTYNLPRSFWPHAFGSPTVSAVADAAKSALILGHEGYRS